MSLNGWMSQKVLNTHFFSEFSLHLRPLHFDLVLTSVIDCSLYLSKTTFTRTLSNSSTHFSMSNSQLSTLDSQALHRFCSTPLPTLINLIGSRLRLQLSPTLSSSSDSPNPIPHSHLDQFQAITIPPMTIEAYLTRYVFLISHLISSYAHHLLLSLF